MIRGLAFIFAFVVVINLGLLASGVLWCYLCRAISAWWCRRRQPVPVMRRWIAPRADAFTFSDGAVAQFNAQIIAARGRPWQEVFAEIERGREIRRAMRGGIDWPGAA